MRLPDDEERYLLQCIAQRDHAALQRLYLNYHRRLSRFLMRMVHRYDFAEEIINDTMWAVWQQADKFRGDSQVSTWIFGIAYRRALKELKRAGRREALVSAEYAHGGEVAADDSEAHRRELRECLDNALVCRPNSGWPSSCAISWAIPAKRSRRSPVVP
jgi:RNA polymerase sigma-70 factor (ECF subfamily)